jgi:hypothetical protein
VATASMVDSRDRNDNCCGALVVRLVPGVGDAHAGVAALKRRDAEPRSLLTYQRGVKKPALFLELMLIQE